MCYSAILLSLPQATACPTNGFEFAGEKSIKGKIKRREIKAVGATEESHGSFRGKNVPVVLASPEIDQF